MLAGNVGYLGRMQGTENGRKDHDKKHIELPKRFLENSKKLILYIILIGSVRRA